MSEMLSSEFPKLTILDVGHGNAAVLIEKSRVAVFDAGKGAQLRRFLKERGVSKVDFLVLSHADSDHIGGAISVLLDHDIQISKVFINPDSTKRDSKSFKQFQAALGESVRLRDTSLELQLTSEVNERFSGGEVEIEVVYPPALVALGGVGGQSASGERLSSNSLSAALRLSYQGEGIVLLGGDIEECCLDHWADLQATVSAEVLVFPHHGGSPGTTSDGAIRRFTRRMLQLVEPKLIVFSNHQTQYQLPRAEILDVVSEDEHRSCFCTRLPGNLIHRVRESLTSQWSYHKAADRIVNRGDVDIIFGDGDNTVRINDRELAN